MKTWEPIPYVLSLHLMASPDLWFITIVQARKVPVHGVVDGVAIHYTNMHIVVYNVHLSNKIHSLVACTKIISC